MMETIIKKSNGDLEVKFDRVGWEVTTFNNSIKEIGQQVVLEI